MHTHLEVIVKIFWRKIVANNIQHTIPNITSRLHIIINNGQILQPGYILEYNKHFLWFESGNNGIILKHGQGQYRFTYFGREIEKTHKTKQENENNC